MMRGIKYTMFKAHVIISSSAVPPRCTESLNVAVAKIINAGTIIILPAGVAMVGRLAREICWAGLPQLLLTLRLGLVLP